ncbi:MAG: helix-turn-helix domain-containing protein [Candidatus Cybelea sp.]
MSDNTAILASADPFALFPRRWLKALQAARASRLAFLVLCDLASYANDVTGKAYPSVDTIAADLGVGVRKVKAAIAELKVIPGILTVQRRNRRAAAPGERSNEYTLTMPADSRKKVASRFAPVKRDDRIGAVLSNDPVGDLPLAERQANVKRLAGMVHDCF